MFVRIAQFEGGSGEGLEERLAEIRRNLSSGDTPAGLAGVTRVLVLVDREGGKMANVVFCDTREELAAADAALDAMSPDDGGGARTGVTLYEAAIDHTRSD